MMILACNRQEIREFAIPEGPATETLKTFASQAGIEILFDPQEVGYSQTQSVSGKLTPEQTLELMLKETTLEFTIDPKSHAFAVVRIDPSDRSRGGR